MNKGLSFGVEDVRGVNNLKALMPTKADISGRDLSKFQIVSPGEFVFNHRTSRNGSKFSIARNNMDKPVICTEDYVVFRVREDCRGRLDGTWLYMYFNRPEFDRYVITNSWGSSTEFYNWEDVCDIEIPLPPIEIQRKYAAVYRTLSENRKAFERGLEDLKLACDGTIEDLQRKLPSERIGDFLVQSDRRNVEGLPVFAVRGLSVSKEMIETKADMTGVGLESYKVVPPGYIAYVPDTSRRGEKISLGFNNTDETFLVSSISTVFTTQKENLLPNYLMLFFSRAEFDRYARFHSWGSARETFDWAEMCDVRIPIPPLPVQESVAELFHLYKERQAIGKKLKEELAEICPVLIKGSVTEAERGA